MSPAVPPVVDHMKRATIEDIKTKSFFNVFNVVAVVAILVIGYFLYKKFSQKFQSGAIKLPSMEPMAAPSNVEAVSAPVIVEEEDVEDSKEE
jgi:hypothetical protein